MNKGAVNLSKRVASIVSLAEVQFSHLDQSLSQEAPPQLISDISRIYEDFADLLEKLQNLNNNLHNEVK